MDGINLGLKQVFKYFFIVSILVATFLVIYFSDNEYVDKFDITVNDNIITAMYDTEYVQYFLKKNGGRKHNRSISNNEDLFNRIEESDNYYLNFKEYEVYDKFGHRTDYNYDASKQELKEVFDNKKSMMVQKDGIIIYEGIFKNNITDIIKEPGRYFFHIYTKQKRSTSPFAYSKTSLHFNFLVGDSNE